jgi:hypothetical protein
MMLREGLDNIEELYEVRDKLVEVVERKSALEER